MREEPRLTAVRVRELIAELGFRGGQTIVDEYVRELRPFYLPRPRTFQCTSYRLASGYRSGDRLAPSYETANASTVACALRLSAAQDAAEDGGDAGR